jgi:uncharacterized repeat protein (TIGR03803 family)
MTALVALAASKANAQTLATLAAFNGDNGQGPQAGLTLIGNTLYGTTVGGGDRGDGTAFSVPVTGGAPTVLASFQLSYGGSSGPAAGVTLSGNTLYGTTVSGGAYGDGTVFSVPLSGGSPTVLVSFSENTNGQNPFGGLTLIGNTLFGTTSQGGASGYGTVFSVPATGGTPTVLASFSGDNGVGPYGDLTLFGNTLYGTGQRSRCPRKPT